ncbi:valine--tRNA ligase [Methylovirgula sp. 4M-Z18]|uniref:valine--tRNA ligase n=1 Tax=Methylovirgula sp. 4M-Z18 TaxID=2293567 RepID=UPI000E2FBE3F|nr:valine--tRNA ligase [Methylovirgula sp. 4M-Z18]RFB80158.1 valine--tRNA ligase [Methylovirgula sp. 4M-Z18]
MMEKTFDPAAVESRIAAAWEAAGAFKSGRPERAGADPYCIVIPPPNVTGNLHMGHALNNTLQDILCRFERMRGKDVLWQPGTDHAGIATQMVVERQLAARQQPGRRELGREKFVEKVWAWKNESGGEIINQLKRLGASCDWSRERFTMDEGLSKAVLKVFVQLYKQGLIYKDKRLVNWDPKFQSAISDIEVQQVEVKGNLWHFKYPVVDADGRETGEFVVVATTRPETMLGDTAVAVHPDDARYRHLQGHNVRLPLVGRLIPVVADEYSDPEKGTGAVKITPAHDFNDFEVGKRHKLPIINVLDSEAKLELKGNQAFLDGLPASHELDDVLALDGLPREQARKRIVAMMEAAELLDKIEPHTHQVPHGDRSGVVIEPWLTPQWYVDAYTLVQPAIKTVQDGESIFIPKNWEKTFFEWVNNIEPWCISRQLWWGHQIPAWYDADGNIFVAETAEEAAAEARAKHGRDVELTRDEDVLDTWFSSALWPFSTLGWPDRTPELKRYYPTNTLVTGFDIIFFWVARMMMMSLHFMGEIPFKDIYLHALVRDEKGAKMSKSKGNGIDPLDIMDGIELDELVQKRVEGLPNQADGPKVASETRKQYPNGIPQMGADALRFYLAAMAAQGRDVKLSVPRIDGYRSFATKLWNAARFAEHYDCVRVEGFDPSNVNETLNKWILGETAKAVAEVTASLEAFRFNDAANAAYRFIWNILCDWHVEFAKPVLQGPDGPAKDEARATIAFVLDQAVKLLHPFMPFLTEELWAAFAERAGVAELSGDQLLTLAPWPDLAGLANAAAEAEIGWLVDLISEIRSVRSEMNVPAGAKIPLVLVGADAALQARARTWQDILLFLARLSDISFADAAPGHSIQMVVRGANVALPLEGVIDFAAEGARLDKEIAKLNGEIRQIDGKLNNEAFVAKAPEEVVEEQRERRDDASARVAKLTAARERLRA